MSARDYPGYTCPGCNDRDVVHSRCVGQLLHRLADFLESENLRFKAMGVSLQSEHAYEDQIESVRELALRWDDLKDVLIARWSAREASRLAVEFGVRAAEKGHNLQAALAIFNKENPW